MKKGISEQGFQKLASIYGKKVSVSSSLSFEDIVNSTKTVDILSTNEGTFDIRLNDNNDVFVVIDDEKVSIPVYYGAGEVGWDILVPEEVNDAVIGLFLDIEEEHPEKFEDLLLGDV